MRKALPVLALCLTTAAIAAPAATEALRASRFWKVDVKQHHVAGPADYIKPALRLDLSALATDQPQYWPNEKVFVKVMALSRGGQTLTGTWKKRDAATKPIEVKLNADGVAVVEMMDGGKQRLELGEYRVELKSSDGKTNLSTTFAVVDGALGAVSFAHEWKRVTNVPDLEKSFGAWFLGNAGGAGNRWGNGLSFKNELRAANHPYSGHATINSRCMLPGCNGTFAGKTLEAEVKDGKVEGTLNVGGHSGPFQIEVVTAQGSLRHQFEGSSHVEREMLTVSGGVGYLHRVSLAPYENTKPIPGRQLYVESKATGGDAFELVSIVAQHGAAQIGIKHAMKQAQLVVWSPKVDGTYEAKAQTVKAELAAGAHLSAPVSAPYSLVTLGGFVDGKFREGWALVFAPSQLEVTVDAPKLGAPNKAIAVSVTVKGGGKVSGILEVFDNRVASKSTYNGLASAIGDSVRATSRSVASWQDTTGISEEARDDSPRAHADKKESIGLGSIGTVGHGAGSGTGSGYGRGSLSAAAPAPMPTRSKRVGGNSGGPNGGGSDGEDDPAAKEIIREGEKKVVFCQLVQTDAQGKAQVFVTLPPQTGRVVARFVAVKGLDHAEGRANVDVKLGAFADARLPRTLVAGAELDLKIDVTNVLDGAVTLTVSGTGIAQPFKKVVARGQSTEQVRLVAKESGKIVLQMSDAQGRAIDRRELPIQLLDDQPVTYSRLEFGGGQQAIDVAATDEVVVYEGAGPLLGGVVMNMVTTTESWFGHAEALSAQAAVDAVLLATIDRKLLSDEGLREQLRSTLVRNVRALDEQFCDKQESLCRPYPGLPTQALWSAWTSRNLHAAVRALGKIKTRDQRENEAYARAVELCTRIDVALKKKGFSLEEATGSSANGDAVIAVEIDGKPAYRVLTDGAVAKWAQDKLMPTLDLDAKTAELGFQKAYDTFRFLRAFERVGALQYETEIAHALYLTGDMPRFAQLYRHITRGMILTQEPGLLQGPALLGGVYSTPMAMVKFLELELAIGEKRAAAQAKLAGKSIAFGARATGGGKLELPPGAIARVDHKDRVRWETSSNQASAKVGVSATQVKVGDELGLEIALGNDLDPTEYYALIAVPSTVAIKQTEDILSDYKGQLIYGQQASGGTRMQVIAVPFRGTRSLKLLLEGAYPGHSFGKVVVRHIEKAGSYTVSAIPEITVR